jgi:DNA excision repair protein ERCC-5
MLSEFCGNIHDVDVTSEAFLALPATVRHEILLELKDSRKQNSWGRIHEMPKKSDDFSSYQLDRLLKRRRLQVSEKHAFLIYVSDALLNLKLLMSYDDDISTCSSSILWVASADANHKVLISPCL